MLVINFILITTCIGFNGDDDDDCGGCDGDDGDDR